MTVTMEHKRKTSWDSKISVSTVSTRRFSRAGTPSSILSSDSDIRFTRKLGGQYRCGCCVLAAFLLFLLFSGVSIYLGYTFLISDPPSDQVFLAAFRVTGGDSFTAELADPSTEAFRIRSREYRDRLNLAFRRSSFKISFIASEVLALDGVEDGDLVVHFDLRFDPRYQTVTVANVLEILLREITPGKAKYLANLTIDPKSLEVQESITALNAQVALPTTVSTPPPTTTDAPPPRSCSKIGLSYCRHLPYNVTSYPNVLGHRSLSEVEEDLIAFRELVDAECFRLAYDFICQVLQPACLLGQPEASLHLPCRNFCREFWAGCGNRLSDRIRAALDCTNFPEYADHGSCRPKPGCVRDLQSKALSPRICDGIIDCPDLSDEKNCAYCQEGFVHCGVGRACIPHAKRCDGKTDCPNGSDEKDCLALAKSVSFMRSQPTETPHSSKYTSEGYVIFNEKGSIGKLCTENLNATLPETEMETVLQTSAGSLCSLLTYTGVNSVEIRIDEEEDIQYVHMEDPSASEITFVRAPCPSKEVMYVRCGDLECGRQALRRMGGTQDLSKMAEPGDWPWHAALFKEEVHVCDATLVAANWLLTTASCFQGQDKAEWSARLGTVRLTSTSPWQQERRIIGMLKSPVEGSTTVLLKLDRPVSAYSDFVRPVCLPSSDEPILANASHCTTLGWARNRDLLQRVELRHSAMERCENISIATVNGICTEAAYSTDDCSEEELAGSPMLCLLSDGRRWALTGVASWRIACSKTGTERPRLYDQALHTKLVDEEAIVWRKTHPSEAKESDLACIEIKSQDPFVLFKEWYDEAMIRSTAMPNALCLATVSKDLKVSARHVILRHYDEQGFIIVTDSRSRKSQELEEVPNAAMCILWAYKNLRQNKISRQVRIEGRMEKLAPEFYRHLYDREPLYCKIRSHLCWQGQVVDWNDQKNRHDTLMGDVSSGKENLEMPDHFIGYRLIPNSMEYYFAYDNFIADRVVFTKESDMWTHQRIAA